MVYYFTAIYIKHSSYLKENSVFSHFLKTSFPSLNKNIIIIVTIAF